jgi:tyrosyl-tRNA synthetase
MMAMQRIRTLPIYNGEVSFRPVPEQLEYLKKGCAEIIRVEDLKARLEQSAKSGKPLTVKVGFDPTAPDLHLGHTVVMRKMRHFQEMGHTVIFVIGDMTGLIGDPTGRNATRPPMTRAEIDKNAETYKIQLFKILDREKTVVRFNSDWLGPLKFEDVIRLASKYTVARILERDDFTKRMRENAPISMHEILYPLAQAYDSVATECDVEMGGTDQKFNLLVGREIQRDYGQPPQIVITLPLLEGTDGVEKMSKSKGNYIGITEPPKDMYRKVMGVSDDLMWRYWELLTDATVAQIAEMKRREPMGVKMELARRIVGDFYSAVDAQQAEEDFNREVRQGAAPSEMVEVTYGSNTDPINVPKMLAATGFGTRTEAERLVKANAVEINGERVATQFYPRKPGPNVVHVGKKWKIVIVKAEN